MNETRDVLRHVIERVQGVLGSEVWVADHLPPGPELGGNLPAVVVDLLPGGNNMKAWGGFGVAPQVDGVVLDIDVFARSRADCVPLADTVRGLLYRLPADGDSPVVSVDGSPLATRPDLNPHVRRLGGDFTVLSRPVPAGSDS